MRALESDSLRARPLACLAVAALARHADDDHELARQAFDTALGLASPDERSWVLRHLVPALPEPWVAEALDHARSAVAAGYLCTLPNALVGRLGSLG